MPRRERCIVPGVPCHVTQRGVDRRETFSADADRGDLPATHTAEPHRLGREKIQGQPELRYLFRWSLLLRSLFQNGANRSARSLALAPESQKCYAVQAVPVFSVRKMKPMEHYSQAGRMRSRLLAAFAAFVTAAPAFAACDAPRYRIARTLGTGASEVFVDLSVELGTLCLRGWCVLRKR